MAARVGVARMARDYLAVYERLIAAATPRQTRSVGIAIEEAAAGV